MNLFYSVARRIPGIRRLYIEIINFRHRQELKGKNAENIFTQIYKENRWASNESLSGPGSAKQQTAAVVASLPAVLSELGIRTMLDIPCGDFNWLKSVELRDVKYTGADIVDDLVAQNKKLYETDSVSFEKLDLLSDSLPKVDLVFCRDCLVHFSSADVKVALKNIKTSGSTYLLTTNFVGHAENEDILTGQWRPLNLNTSPFDLPPPVKAISEECTENDGEYSDKSLCLWRIDDLPVK
ncbi:MAG: class I SAM-dependent methyltransferase [Chloracidobacterium sp.]|nr:class I SAM-dependent methyltransferase [Chloracidobacterium sp.]MBL0241373.1 class I SAM-dependent methyltransferase [Chloracidobacterium sp.]